MSSGGRFCLMGLFADSPLFSIAITRLRMRMKVTLECYSVRGVSWRPVIVRHW